MVGSFKIEMKYPNEMLFFPKAATVTTAIYNKPKIFISNQQQNIIMIKLYQNK